MDKLNFFKLFTNNNNITQNNRFEEYIDKLNSIFTLINKKTNETIKLKKTDEENKILQEQILSINNIFEGKLIVNENKNDQSPINFEKEYDLGIHSRFTLKELKRLVNNKLNTNLNSEMITKFNFFK